MQNHLLQNHLRVFACTESKQCVQSLIMTARGLIAVRKTRTESVRDFVHMLAISGLETATCFGYRRFFCTAQEFDTVFR
jgi:hypothetical protein